jgi:hypothetical protein
VIVHFLSFVPRLSIKTRDVPLHLGNNKERERERERGRGHASFSSMSGWLTVNGRADRREEGHTRMRVNQAFIFH